MTGDRLTLETAEERYRWWDALLRVMPSFVGDASVGQHRADAAVLAYRVRMPVALVRALEALS